jgi:rubrerythrin
MRSPDRKKLLRSLEDELNGVELYRALSEAEKNPKLAEVFRRIAMAEQGHADHLAGMLKKSGVEIPRYVPSFRTRVLGWIAKKFGVGLVLPTVLSLEYADST